MKIIPVIVGPTSSGKTSCALEFCKRHRGQIISADSRQVIKFMDAGTGKKPLEDVDCVKGDGMWVVDGVDIWGYDLTDPNSFFSAYDYALYGINKITEVTNQHEPTLIVGGTGFYIDILIGRIKPANTIPNFELRTELETYSTDQLRGMYKRLKTETSTSIDESNRMRLIRAIERLSSTATRENLKYPLNIHYAFYGLTADNSILYQRVDKWLDLVWGAVCEETRWLYANGYSKSVRLKGLVYKSALAFINGELEQSKARERAKFDLHAYIRRQKTYFNKNKSIKWFDITDDTYKEKLYNALSLSAEKL